MTGLRPRGSSTVRIDLRHTVNTPDSNAALIALTAAAQGERRVHLHYEAADGARSERDFDPYGLAYRIGAWYAVGHCHLRNALRSFRLDRIGDVHVLESGFTRPANFDVLDHLLQSIAAIPRVHRIEVILRTDLDAARKAFPLDFGMLEPLGSDVVLHSSADDLAWFARQLAALPFDFLIRAPAQLRIELGRRAARLQQSSTMDG